MNTPGPLDGFFPPEMQAETRVLGEASPSMNMTDVQFEAWDGNLGILDAFDQFLASTPNIDPASYGAVVPPKPPSDNPATSRQSSDTGHSHPQLNKTISANDRKQQNNRAAQKRFRARQKAKSQTIEAQLADTTAQLNELKVKQKQLEARNALLEKVATMNRQSSTGSSSSPSLPSDDRNPWQTETEKALITLAETTERGPAIRLTVFDDNKVMLVEEAGKMTQAEFAKTLSTYARKLGGCLLEATDDECPAAERMHRWTMELTSLMMCVALGSKIGFKYFQGYNMETGKVDLQELGDSFYIQLLTALDLTEAQQRDMIHLRRLFCGRLGQLSRERKDMITQMPTDTAGMRLCHASDKLTEMEQLAEKLKANGAAEYRSYVQLSSAFYRGIQTTRQHAISVVHSYPYIPEKNRVLEVLAASRGEPSSESLMQAGGIDDFQHAANWQQVEEYLKGVNTSNLHLHIPFLTEPAVSANSGDSQGGVFADSAFDLAT